MPTTALPGLSPVANIQALFKKEFRTKDYLYADSTKCRKTEINTDQNVRDADYDNEERMLAAMEKIEVLNANAMVPDEFWVSFKRFVSQTVAAKRQNEKDLVKKSAKLRNYKDLEDLESRIAELQSHRIELIRELAQDEKSFADNFRLKSKVDDVLKQTNAWANVTKEVFNHIFAEKKTADMLRDTLPLPFPFP